MRLCAYRAEDDKVAGVAEGCLFLGQIKETEKGDFSEGPLW